MGRGNAAGRADAAAVGRAGEIGEAVRSSAELRDDRLSPDHGLTFANERLNAFRQIEIGAAAKSYDPQTVAAMDGIALAQRAQDTAGDQTRDLHHGQFPAIG